MLRAGDKIDSFTLVRELGRGGFGVVWLAEERTIFAAPRVALKIALEDKINLEAIKQEATLWSQASGHINVLPIFGVRVCGEHIVIVSEYVPDGSLEEWLARHGGRAPSVEAAADMAFGILSGLEHLHSKGIIHRDLKPANILLQGETPRLTDFGLARLLKPNKHSMGVAGTLPYMAPEAFDGGRSEQSDVWAAGVIFYQMLAGDLPFPQQDIRSLIQAIDAQEPPPLPSVPRPISDVIARALEKERGRRYRSAAEMRHALRAAMRELVPSPQNGHGASAAPTQGEARPTPRPLFDNAAPDDPRLAPTLPLSSAQLPTPDAGGGRRSEARSLTRLRWKLRSKRLWLGGGGLLALLVIVLTAAAVRKLSTGARQAEPPRLAKSKASDDARLHAEMGRMLKDRSEWPQAEAEYRKAVEADGDDLDTRLQLAYALRQVNRDDEALAQYAEVERRARESLRANPGDAASHHHLGAALTDQGKYTEGEAALREALRLAPDNSEYHRELGLNLYNQSRYPEAEVEAREAARLNPAFFRNHLLLSATLIQREKYVDGEAAAREAVRLNPKYAFSHRYLADALLGQKKYAEAEAEYREAVRLFPTWAGSRVGLGRVLSEQKKYAAAEAEYKEAIRLEPEDSGVRYTFGDFLYNRGRYREAEATFREAVRLGPDDAYTHNYLGWVLQAQKKYAEAEAEYREAIRLSPRESMWRGNLGNVLAAQKKYAEAEAGHREAISAAPDVAGFHDNLGDFLLDRARHSEAEAAFREAVRMKPDEDDYHNGLGVALERQKRYREAEAEYREAVRLDPNNPLYHRNLGFILNRLKKSPAEARAELATAKRLEKK